MRIARLDLLAYGPFRGVSLDFSASGLHLVLGRNEAGKSTTLRAIGGLLFGIDRRTRDAHTHKPGDLRIGGTLESAGGERVRVVRRKGDANTLASEEGKVLDEAVLLRLLGGVTKETFASAFGLDHVTLREGAAALLEGHGALGETLFDASVGGGGEVQRLKRQLEQEADAIYRPRGQSFPLNEALKQFAEAHKLVREKQSLPDAYVTQQRALEEADSEKQRRAAHRAELAAKKIALERAKKRVPLERRRTSLLQDRATLGPAYSQGPRIEAVAAGLSTYDRSLRELKETSLEESRLRDRAAEAALRAGAEGKARMDARTEGRIQKLLGDRTIVSARIASTRADILRAEKELARATPEAAADLDARTPEIGRALQRARTLGDVEARYEAARTRTARRRADLEKKARALGVVDVPLDAFVVLRLPPIAAVERLVARAAEVDVKGKSASARLEDLDRETASLERQIGEHSGDFAPPAQADLRAARARRGDAWHALRAASGKERGDRELEFERALHEADEVADRMIREADRVTMLARLRSSAETLAKQRDAARADLAAIEGARRAIESELASLFHPIAAVGAAEMHAFLERHARIVEEHERLRDEEIAEGDLAASIASSTRDLAAALGVTPDGKSLAELVAAASRHLDAFEARARTAALVAKTREKLATEIDTKTASLEADERTLADVRSALVEVLAPLGLSADASAEEVQHTLEARRELEGLESKRAEAEARRAAAEKDVRAFEETIARVTAELAPDVVGQSTQEAAAMLLSRARKAQAVASDLATIEAQLAELGSDAIAPDLADLAADSERAQAAVDQLESELAEVDRELSKIDQSIGGIRAALEGWRSDSGAAEASLAAQQALARIRTNVERYCRAKLSAAILAREIEKFREENQGPLLGGASSLFAHLTRGAFEGVRAGFTDKDVPALRCVRAGGMEVDVDGLSEGTRDQLYLALRLASLERHAKIAEPMPLVLDDVLIHFDDERAKAALDVLARIACTMQVIFFTHHARDVELARAVVPEGSLHVHELGAPSPERAQMTVSG